MATPQTPTDSDATDSNTLESTNYPSSADEAYQATDKNIDAEGAQRDMVLTHREAMAGSYDEGAITGEEDPGSALEFLVTRDEHDD